MAKSFTIPGAPVPKPRQTQRDKWQKRPCVMNYRAWADEARLRSGKLPVAWKIEMRFYLPVPASKSAGVRAKLIGALHSGKPDIDNLAKAVMDALYPKGDDFIAVIVASKYWDDGRGPRTEVIVE